MSSNENAAARLVRVAANNPEAEFEAFLQNKSPLEREVLLAVDFDFCEYWRDAKNSVALTALFHVERNGSVVVSVLRRERFDHCEKRWRAQSRPLEDLLQDLPAPLVALDKPISLRPIAIAKPWGQEIWYTGIEQRGVAEVGEPDRRVPLPWLLAVAPQRLTGGAQQPILLKILDPLPEPVFGDLYFELHREKQEVYVVTAIDPHAWPGGEGAIRFGFDTQKRRAFGSDGAFLQAYLAAVREYRSIRKQIDTQIDALRTRDGVGLNEPVAASTLASWLRQIDPALQARESELRVQMESFTSLKPLRVGDVVKVPCLLPHSLQHGVRTVEFQTPVYERLILSFAQKVLTQPEWDTDEAAGVLQLDAEPSLPFPLLSEGQGWREEQIVRFDDFEVRRITLQAHARAPLDVVRGYALGMVVGQPLMLGGNRLRPDDAVLLPTQCQPQILGNDSDAVAYFLLALPLS